MLSQSEPRSSTPVARTISQSAEQHIDHDTQLGSTHESEVTTAGSNPDNVPQIEFVSDPPPTYTHSDIDTPQTREARRVSPCQSKADGRRQQSGMSRDIAEETSRGSDSQPRVQESEKSDPHPLQTPSTEKDSTYYPIDKIIKMKVQNGQRQYYVQWSDTTRSWQPEANLSDYALRDYFSHHTKLGKAKRRKGKKFFDLAPQ